MDDRRGAGEAGSPDELWQRKPGAIPIPAPYPFITPFSLSLSPFFSHSPSHSLLENEKTMAGSKCRSWIMHTILYRSAPTLPPPPPPLVMGVAMRALRWRRRVRWRWSGSERRGLGRGQSGRREDGKL